MKLVSWTPKEFVDQFNEVYGPDPGLDNIGHKLVQYFDFEHLMAIAQAAYQGWPDELVILIAKHFQLGHGLPNPVIEIPRKDMMPLYQVQKLQTPMDVFWEISVPPEKLKRYALRKKSTTRSNVRRGDILLYSIEVGKRLCEMQYRKVYSYMERPNNVFQIVWVEKGEKKELGREPLYILRGTVFILC